MQFGVSFKEYHRYKAKKTKFISQTMELTESISVGAGVTIAISAVLWPESIVLREITALI